MAGEKLSKFPKLCYDSFPTSGKYLDITTNGRVRRMKIWANCVRLRYTALCGIIFTVDVSMYFWVSRLTYVTFLQKTIVSKRYSHTAMILFQPSALKRIHATVQEKLEFLIKKIDPFCANLSIAQ